MVPLTGRKIIQAIADAVFPNNCRRELKIAAAKNAQAIDSVLELLRAHPEKIIHVLKEERRMSRRA